VLICMLAYYLTWHASTFEKLTQPTGLQAEALDLAAHAPVVVVR